LSIPTRSRIGNSCLSRRTQRPARELVTFAHVNNVTTTLELLSDFQHHLETMDINPGLSRNKGERMRQVIQNELLVFAFGSKKLGQPDMVTMTL
jgi:hypothetical protein